MKKFIYALCLMPYALSATAGYDDARFKREIRNGLDIVSANETAYSEPDPALGELGLDVYQVQGAVTNDELDLFIPTNMYIRGGAGANLGSQSGTANDLEQSGGWTSQIGIGWDLSSYVRTEIDFQNINFGFSKSDATASAREFGGTLYFDFARRWVRRGDITRRRILVPFMGLGAGAGAYNFQGAFGNSGAFIAPRGIFGLNLALTDLVGLDFSYQYKAFVSNGFGWGDDTEKFTGLSDIMATIRFNF